MTKNCSHAEFVVSNTQMSGLNYIIDEIKQELEKDSSQEIILVVPDKFSMNAEQIFMERTGLSSVFNVWITTLSRLVSKVVADDMKGFKLLTKNSGVMLVSKIILENADKLSTYKKVVNDYSLAETMYNAINLLKSSGVMPAELKDNFGQTTFGLKMQDLYAIYSEYEKCMKENADVITRLQIFDKKIKNDEYVKNSKIYFAMFDSFTNVQINSLCQIAKNCKNFCISLCANTLQNNFYIYDNTLLHKLKDSFQECNIDVQIKNINAILSPMGSFLAKNMFSYKPVESFEAENLKVFESDFVENEVRYVASRIKFLVMEKGYVFDDINVAINGLEQYANDILKIFNEFDLPFYLDIQRKLTDHFLIKTLLRIFTFISGDTSTANAVSIVKSSIFEIDYQKKCNFDNYCQKYAVYGDDFLNPFAKANTELVQNAEEVRSAVFDGIDKLQKNLEACQCVKDMCDILTGYVQKLWENRTENGSQVDDLLQNRINQEAYKKLLDILADASNMFGATNMSKDMFFDMLQNSFTSTNLLTVPTGCNAVFAGDASNSTYFPRKILFVMGATQSQMPSYKTSSGAITDEEIDRFVSSKRISPTLADLNKREKFKLFNLLLLPSDILELSFSTITAGESQQKSEFITALQKIITQNGKHLAVQKIGDLELYINEKSSEKFPLYLIGTMQNAVRVANSKESNLKTLITKHYDDIIKAQTEPFKDGFERFKISDAKGYLFKNQKTSISQIEKYFKCPFLQFVTYAIKPQEREKFEIKTNIVGIILHSVAEEFVTYCIQNDYNIKNAEMVAKKIYKKVLNREEFEMFKSNRYFSYLLEDESVRFCRAIEHQINSSDFRPNKTEYRFQECKLNNDIKFSGVVDRIDTCQTLNAVRIVDYKSGSDKFSFKDIYYGLKLQLIAYLKIISKQFDMSMAGAFYMPVKNKFNEINSSEFKSYKLDGVLLDDVNMLMHHDKNLMENLTSDILPVQLTTDGSISKRSGARMLSSGQFEDVAKYTFDVINNAVDEMISGYIEPKPYVDSKNPCEYCQYKALCHFEYEKKGFRKLTQKNKFSFAEDEK